MNRFEEVVNYDKIFTEEHLTDRLKKYGIYDYLTKHDQAGSGHIYTRDGNCITLSRTTTMKYIHKHTHTMITVSWSTYHGQEDFVDIIDKIHELFLFMHNTKLSSSIYSYIESRYPFSVTVKHSVNSQYCNEFSVAIN